MKRLSLFLIVIVLLALGSAAVARAGPSVSANYAVPSNVLASGGQTASSANYTVASTLGQPASGQGASASYSVCSGFWCQAQTALAQLFLPLVRR
jgi:parvulin-like peptidyl-prolyl isomerase